MINSLNPSQRAAATYTGDRHQLILAPAGSGKTSTLIARVYSLVTTGTHPSRILVLTFTRRAAREKHGQKS